jgi:hypothetical protein
MTRLGKINYCFLQWFFIRLCRVVESGRYRILWGVVPLSGWGEKPFKYVLNKASK